KWGVVLGESRFISVPVKPLVSFLVVEEHFEFSVGPSLGPKMPLHRAHYIDKFRLVSRSPPRKERSGPFWIDRQIHKRDRSRAASGVRESAAIQQWAVVAIKQFPTGNVFFASRPRQSRSVFRPNFASVSVSELMKRAAVFVKQPMIGMDQTEQRL